MTAISKRSNDKLMPFCDKVGADSGFWCITWGFSGMPDIVVGLKKYIRHCIAGKIQDSRFLLKITQ